MPKPTQKTFVLEEHPKVILPVYESRELMNALIHSVVSQVAKNGKPDSETARLAIDSVKQVIKGEVKMLLAKSDAAVSKAQADAYKKQTEPTGGN